MVPSDSETSLVVRGRSSPRSKPLSKVEYFFPSRNVLETDEFFECVAVVPQTVKTSACYANGRVTGAGYVLTGRDRGTQSGA